MSNILGEVPRSLNIACTSLSFRPQTPGLVGRKVGSCDRLRRSSASVATSALRDEVLEVAKPLTLARNINCFCVLASCFPAPPGRPPTERILAAAVLSLYMCSVRTTQGRFTACFSALVCAHCRSQSLLPRGGVFEQGRGIHACTATEFERFRG